MPSGFLMRPLLNGGTLGGRAALLSLPLEDSVGTTFRYISDEALTASDLGPCHCCEDASRPAYAYGFGLLVEEASATPEADSYIHAACCECITSGRVKRDLFEIADQVELSGSHMKVELLETVHLIPTIPLFLQRWEWPICCDDWCEFTGSPTEMPDLLEIVATHAVWPPGFSRNFAEDGPPESFREISTFRCLTCAKKHFVDQYT
jgi:hypothetical protein